jgi:hypothetical protein
MKESRQLVRQAYLFYGLDPWIVLKRKVPFHLYLKLGGELADSIGDLRCRNEGPADKLGRLFHPGGNSDAGGR